LKNTIQKTASKIILFSLIFCVFSCTQTNEEDFQYLTEQFSDLKIIRYKVPGFENFELKQKTLIYYLSQAALSGRDIIFDQNYRHNLKVRKTLETIISNYSGDRDTENFQLFTEYTKRVWFSGGIHHHYSTKKITPQFSSEYFINDLITNTESSEEFTFPLDDNTNKIDLARELNKIIFNLEYDSKRVNLASNADIILNSANNYYAPDITFKEASEFYKKESEERAPEYGLNSKLSRNSNGDLFEQTYKLGGMYSDAIEQIIYWIEKAKTVAENEDQEKSFDLLIEYYKTGDIHLWDEYNIQWVKTQTDVDWINGFIEVYGDAAGRKGAYESVIQVKDMEASAKTEVINEWVQWFEDNSPIMDEHKKPDVKGVTYKVINTAMESGDASPSTPIGINLPNNNWIRTEHGSKSISLGNILSAYDGASTGGGFLDEFCYTEDEIERSKQYGSIGDKLATLLHEVVGHASGLINEGVGTPKETLLNYASTLEEARADLVALYYIITEKPVEIGLMPSVECGKAEYDSYIRNGLMLQLRRIEPGENIEESHMRNRQLIASWAYERGLNDNIIEKKIKTDSLGFKKTFFVVNDYEKLQIIFGELLREIQRIKSEGDFIAGQNLVEDYGVKVDTSLHKEVLERSKKLNSAPYGGFINPKYTIVNNTNGEIEDILISYPNNFEKQMMEYARDYSFLNHNN